MPSPKFAIQHEARVEETTVQVGLRRQRPMFKIITSGGSTFFIDEDEANDLADAMDEALAYLDDNPGDFLP